jgi:glycosyltransferase involved in cell wall biosynthesis
MRIGIDVRPIAEERRSGVEEYIKNLLENIFLLDKKNNYILFYNSYKNPLPKLLTEFEKYPNVFIRRFHYPNKVLNFFLWYFKFPHLDKLLDVDIFYSPNLIFTALSSQCQSLITMHDLSFERHPEFFNFYRRLWHWLVNPRALVQKAEKVISVSESSRADIINLYHHSSKKVELIYPGIAKNIYFCDRKDEAFLKISRKYKLPLEYILFLATLEPRKNMESVVAAYDYLRGKDKIKHKLVIAGGEGWMFKKTRQLILKSKYNKDIILIGEVENEERKYIYSGADLFVYPSFYEGFGFPPLEALACGTTVVCSYTASLPEVVGDAALLVDPYNYNEMALAIEKGIKDKKLKILLREKGFKQARKFSWLKSARKFLNLIEKMEEGKY